MKLILTLLGTAFLVLLVVIGGAAAFMVPVSLHHNREAKETLAILLQQPLPPNSRPAGNDWAVGAYEGASNLCEGLATIGVRSDASPKEVFAFYAKLFPTFKDKVDSDFHIARADSLPQFAPSEIALAANNIIPTDRSKTYIIWGIRPLGENSWDPRGW